MAFEKVAALDELREGEALPVTVGGLPVALARGDDDQVYAVHDLCTHAEVALSEGDVSDCRIECWGHGSWFDLRSGKPVGPPATDPVATFPVEVRDGQIYVDITTTLNGVSAR